MADSRRRLRGPLILTRRVLSVFHKLLIWREGAGTVRQPVSGTRSLNQLRLD